MLGESGNIAWEMYCFHHARLQPDELAKGRGTGSEKGKEDGQVGKGALLSHRGQTGEEGEEANPEVVARLSLERGVLEG